MIRRRTCSSASDGFLVGSRNRIVVNVGRKNARLHIFGTCRSYQYRLDLVVIVVIIVPTSTTNTTKFGTVPTARWSIVNLVVVIGSTGHVGRNGTIVRGSSSSTGAYTL